ncbi:recombinase family protein [Metabacillus halosaccharovorans]|uniref:recombinase family protein n=1 Tax=Metabacillus halosaccharovorans TaxID=930124 RepID=UPI001C1FF884|nr:recombinase family protein [Metabacillus halosaccharovorans]MBU7593564.1 recombinase family protein [Metabacillus halosaccharovorans]
MLANDNIKHVAIYLRLSRDEENRGIEEMLASHRHTLTELCKQNGWSYEIFEEIASSRTIEKRDKMVELLERIQKNHFDAVVVMDIDRLSRNEFDSVEIKKILFMTGTSIVTPSKFYNLSKDEDNLLLGIQSLVAAQEYKQILKRMQRGKLYASKQGHWTNGIPPLGYDKNPKTKKLVPNEQAEHVKYIFNSLVNGKTISDVYHHLNKYGVTTRTGSNFHFNAILRIVNNETYKGTIVSNRVIGKHEAERPKSQWIIVENAHPAIIDEDTWERANKIVNTYSFSAPRSKNKIYPTTKLIYCGNCGKVQGAQYHPHINKLYLKMCKYCKNRTYLYEPILKIIKGEIATYRQKVLNSIEIIENNNDSGDTEYKIKQLESQIRRATQALDNIEILFEESEINLQQYRDRKAKRKQQLEQLNLELENLKTETPKDKVADLSEVLKQIDYLLGKWECLDGEGLTDEEVNRSLHYIIDRIEWKYGKNDEAPELKIKYYND